VRKMWSELRSAVDLPVLPIAIRLNSRKRTLKATGKIMCMSNAYSVVKSLASDSTLACCYTDSFAGTLGSASWRGRARLARKSLY
jgi:hypothetical protein